MERTYFFYKDKEEAANYDRDCVKYIELRDFEYNTFRGWSTGGAAHWGGRPKFYDKDNMITCLSRVEIRRLVHFNKHLDKLGWKIEKGDENYQIGLELYNSVKDIFDKLAGSINEHVFKRVINQEMIYLRDEYNLTFDEIKFIFNNYYQMYRDRAIVSYVFKDIDDCAHEEALSLGYIKYNDWNSERYFNFETFGQDLLEEDGYLELDDGRIVYLNY